MFEFSISFFTVLKFQLSKKKTHFLVNGQIGGYVPQYKRGKVTFATVRGAGHMVPTDKPPVAEHLIQSFLFNKAF